MAVFIIFLISVLIIGTLLRYTYPQKRTRTSVHMMWKGSPWENDGEERCKYPIWMWLIALILVTIPVLNLIISVVLIIAYIIQLGGVSGSDGYKLIDTRIVVRAPYLMWVKWLNKKI